MRILILGNKTNVLDEGAKNVATNLSKAFEKNSDVLTIHQRKAWHLNNIIKSFRFSPDIVLSIHGPSIKTIIIIFIYKILCRCKSVIVAAQPHDKKMMLRFASLFKPDYLFAQSKYWFDRFNKCNIKTQMLANGVDTDKFTDIKNDEELKSTLSSLNLNENDKILLHIGPINYNRNHELLMELAQNTDWKIIIIGSTTAPFNEALFNKIKAAGVIAINEYFPHINQLYAISDYYIFPVLKEDGSIEFPLTVLEAMSSNCPVISTRFKGIPDFIKETSSFRYFSTYDEILNILNTNKPTDNNRAIALDFSWKKIAKTIEDSIN
ncbi:hypothetical protein MNBD_GAMMA05-631 [hydrothermal vent metagenome]|uniref:Glycosyl transferase family 1 domain-containing protein n=1 Tax=hydrothermal vent metagenome TaxID=652676 RepID=A0A3B0WSG0_9ZZZZ